MTTNLTMSMPYDSPSRRSNRISGQNPIEDIDVKDASPSKELRSLLCSGGSGGKMKSRDDNWTFFSTGQSDTASGPPLDVHDNLTLPSFTIHDGSEKTNNDVNVDQEDNCYQLINPVRLQELLNDNCVCRCQLNREIDRFIRHCATLDNQMTQ